MKRLFFIASLLILAECGFVQAQGVQIKINGSQSFVLNESNGMYFHNDTITVDGTDFAIDDINVITFEVLSGIDDVEKMDFEMLPNPATNAVVLRGIGSQATTVTVFSTAGIKLLEQKAVDGTIIDISSLPEGIYILRCGYKVSKIVKQL